MSQRTQRRLTVVIVVAVTVSLWVQAIDTGNALTWVVAVFCGSMLVLAGVLLLNQRR